jgi:hypothetical protein
VASWQFTCVGHGGGRKYGSKVDIVILINPCFKQNKMAQYYKQGMQCYRYVVFK